MFKRLTTVHYRSLLWIGPALLFSTATAVSMLGWDGTVRTILSVSMPYAGIYLSLCLAGHSWIRYFFRPEFMICY